MAQQLADIKTPAYLVSSTPQPAPMADEKKDSNPFTVQAVQAGLASVLTIIFISLHPASAKEATVIANFLSLLAVWAGWRLLKKMDADDKAKEPTMAMRNLLAEVEQKLALLEQGDTLRPTLERQRKGLTEAIYNKTLEQKFEPLPGDGTKA